MMPQKRETLIPLRKNSPEPCSPREEKWIGRGESPTDPGKNTSFDQTKDINVRP